MCRHASVIRFAARWRALYAALQMEDTLAGHPLAMAFPAQKPGFLEAKGRSSRHRWLVDSGANNHMVTDTTQLTALAKSLLLLVTSMLWMWMSLEKGIRELSHHCDH